MLIKFGKTVTNALGFKLLNIGIPKNISLCITVFGSGGIVIEWRAVWCAVAWSIWCHINKIVFEGEQMDFDAMVELIWFRAWFSAKVKNFFLLFL